MTQYHPHQQHHHLKRLQNFNASDLRGSTSTSSRPHSHDSRSALPSDEAMRESIQNFSIETNSETRLDRPFKPGPHRARRGGARSHDRRWHPTVALPKRMINYDLAESFVDHSTNPLSSALYRIRFKHSNKQWPEGRFIHYKEKLDRSDGTIVDVTCSRTLPLVPKRKKIAEVALAENTAAMPMISPPAAASMDPIVQEAKKKQANKQTNVYANLFGCGKIPRLPPPAQRKKCSGLLNGPASSAAISLLGENKEDQLC